MGVRVPLMAGAILALATLGGCGGGGGGPTAAPSGPVAIECNSSGSGGSASMADFSFTPNPASAALGGVVTWTNNDGTSHTVSFDSGPDCGTVVAGGTQTIKFNIAGTYAYHCNIHRSMEASVTVQ